MSSQNFIPTIQVVKRKKVTEMHRNEETVELVDEGMGEKEHSRAMIPHSDCQMSEGEEEEDIILEKMVEILMSVF